MADNEYLAAGFDEVDASCLARFVAVCQHEARKFEDTTVLDGFVRVMNAASFDLDKNDTVWVDRFGRVNAVRHGDRFLVASET